MANAHITAAFRCSQFKGTIRLVLLALADAASPGGKNKEGKKNLPLGYCRRRLQTIMSCVNVHRQQTVTAAISELEDYGAIKVHHRKGASLFFVDLQWLNEHAYSDEQLEQFVYPALAKQRKAANEDISTPESPETYSDHSQTLGRAYSEREAANQDNEKRLTTKTDSVMEFNGKRLRGFQSVPTEQSSSDFPTQAELAAVPKAAELPSAQLEEKKTENLGETPNPHKKPEHEDFCLADMGEECDCPCWCHKGKRPVSVESRHSAALRPIPSFARPLPGECLHLKARIAWDRGTPPFWDRCECGESWKNLYAHFDLEEAAQGTVAV